MSDAMKRGRRTYSKQQWRERRRDWLSRPQLDTEIFKKFERDERVAIALEKSSALGTWMAITSVRRDEIKSIARRAGWSGKRLATFKRLAVQYRREPTIENYVSIRRRFPEVEIEIGRFNGVGQLYFLSPLFRAQGIDPELVSDAIGGDEPGIDALALRLLKLLIAREKLPQSGPNYIESRRSAISDATVNYLIAFMLEACACWRIANFRIRTPASLVVLVRHQLCGLQPDLHTAYESRRERDSVALLIGQRLGPTEPLSINRATALVSHPQRSTLALWCSQPDFRAMVEEGRQCEQAAVLERDQLARSVSRLQAAFD